MKWKKFFHQPTSLLLKDKPEQKLLLFWYIFDGYFLVDKLFLIGMEVENRN